MNQIKAKNEKKKKIYLKKETKENELKEDNDEEQKEEDKKENVINNVKTGGFFITNQIDFEGDDDQMKIVDGLKHINSLIREDSDNKEEHESNKKESIIKTEIEESPLQSNDNTNI